MVFALLYFKNENNHIVNIIFIKHISSFLIFFYVTNDLENFSVTVDIHIILVSGTA